ncbi:Bug family tripartite tricarboxylate transporter substrate binding protein [Sediminicoccus rosea]|uniref:Tripartite tricarboxylate transporter substrate-binding protein n=1 Tax=Sediminicoccus rosea TaxID=1225128 RepID=A0ABZ0PBZ0_9PROT|nr:tripartite tricarboxylate transporter substrate-binding protein [Sediminicoccus rosea]WPB83209.1 tripartite tricarboxylate transporter substrate-binding protein [Sediminicoccus rosea]
MLLAAGLAVPAVAQAQRRTLRVIVPFPPGGAVDSLGRILADRLTPLLEQTVIVENRVGAGGVVGADAVAKSAPDGSTIGIVGAASILAAPLLQPSMPFDAMRDLLPVTQITDAAVLCVANAETARRENWRGLPDLLATARARPGAIRIGTTGVATVSHLALAAIAAGAGVEFLHVPYRGGSEAMQAVLAGEVDGLCDLPPLLSPQVAAGRLLALSVSSRARLQFLPDVPGFGEVPALARFDIRSWNMIMLAAGTPGGERARLFAALTRIGRDEAFRAALRPLSYDAVVSDSPEAAQRFITDEAPRWRELVRLSGARVH